MDGWTDKMTKDGGQGHPDQQNDPYADLDILPDFRRCLHCNGNGQVNAVALPDRTIWLHRECEAAWMEREKSR
jgi:hypothetical protein